MPLPSAIFAFLAWPLSRFFTALILIYLILQVLIFRGVLANVETNRRLVQKLRTLMGADAFFPVPPEAITAWSESSAIYWTRLAFVPIIAYMPILQIAEGQALVIVPLYMICQAAGTCLFLQKRAIDYLHFLNFVVFLQWILTLLIFDTYIPPGVMDRMLLFRAMQSFFTIEQLDICFIHFCVTLLCNLTRQEHPAFSTSMMLFFIFNVPSSILHVRGVLTLQLRHRPSRLVVLLIPLIFIFSGLSSYSFSVPQSVRWSRLVASSLMAVLGLWIDMVPELLTRTTWTHLNWRQSFLTFVTLLVSIGLIQHCCIILFGPGIQLALIPLCSLLVGVFSTAPLKSVTANFAVLSATLFVLPDSESALERVCLGALSCFSNFFILQTREDTQKLLIKDSMAENFIAHALKQKFVASGMAIQSALTIGKSLPQSVQDQYNDILSQALIECNIGHDLCHLTSVSRKIFSKAHTQHLITATIEEIQSTWSSRLPAIIHVELISRNEPSPPLEMEWELAWILMAKLCLSKATDWCTIRLGWYAVNKTQAFVTVLVERAAKQSLKGAAAHNRSIQLVLGQLGGTFASSNLEVLLPAAIKLKPKTPKVPLHAPPTVSSSTVNSVPPGLVVALLDDNLLSRKAFFRFANLSLNCSSASFVRGETFEECFGFCAEICDRKPDIVVLDQHLEYFDRETHQELSVLGTDIAKQARLNGYTGCLLLLTANEQTIDNIDPSFDGGMVKSIDMNKLYEQVALAYARAQERRGRILA